MYPRLAMIHSDFMCDKWWFYDRVILGEQSKRALKQA
jgi:hypothetical protein